MAVDTPIAVGSVSIQGNDYPIYGSQDRARQYFNASTGGTGFTGVAFGDQQRALVTARRLLDRQSFLGSPTVEGQFTAFPRDGATTVPIPVEVAQYELSLLLLADAEVFNQRTTGSNVRRLRAGPVEIENFSQTLRSNQIGGGAGLFPPQVLDLLRPFLSSPVTITAPVAGGITNQSFVISRQGNDISDGL